MEQNICALVRTAIAEGMTEQLHLPICPEQIRLPARGAAAGCAVAIARGADAAEWVALLQEGRERFPKVLDAELLRAVEAHNGWLLFHLHDAFYIAAARAAATGAQIPEAHEHYPLHRLRMLARYADCACPNDRAVQQALLLCLAANESPTAANRSHAEEALLTMAQHLPPAERMGLLSRCGTVARAAIHLLYGI